MTQDDGESGVGGDFRDLDHLLRGYRSTLIRDLVFGTFGETSEDLEAPGRKLPVSAMPWTRSTGTLWRTPTHRRGTPPPPIVYFFGVLSFSVAIIAATYRSTQQTSYRSR